MTRRLLIISCVTPLLANAEQLPELSCSEVGAITVLARTLAVIQHTERNFHYRIRNNELILGGEREQNLGRLTPLETNRYQLGHKTLIFSGNRLQNLVITDSEESQVVVQRLNCR